MTTPSTNKCIKCGEEIKYGMTFTRNANGTAQHAPGDWCKPTVPSVWKERCGKPCECRQCYRFCENYKPCPLHEKPSVCEHKNTFVSKSTRKGTRKICHDCNAVLPKQPTPQQEEASLTVTLHWPTAVSELLETWPEDVLRQMAEAIKDFLKERDRTVEAPHDGSQGWDARRIVQEIDRRMQEPEIKERGFPSFYLEAIERSINKLVATEIAQAEKRGEERALEAMVNVAEDSMRINRQSTPDTPYYQGLTNGIGVMLANLKDRLTQLKNPTHE